MRIVSAIFHHLRMDMVDNWLDEEDPKGAASSSSQLADLEVWDRFTALRLARCDRFYLWCVLVRLIGVASRGLIKSVTLWMRQNPLLGLCLW